MARTTRFAGETPAIQDLWYRIVTAFGERMASQYSFNSEIPAPPQAVTGQGFKRVIAARGHIAAYGRQIRRDGQLIEPHKDKHSFACDGKF